jgi:hypothetical protein
MLLISRPSRTALVLLPLAILSAAAPALARPGVYPGGWNDGMMGPGEFPRRQAQKADSSNEGKVAVSRFVAPDLAPGTLGHGPVSVTTAQPAIDSGPYSSPTFEAAVIDRLVQAGYDTTIINPAGGQTVELHITRHDVQPQEAPHKPVSGEMSMGVSNRGSMMGMAVNVDLSKPRAALVSTRLEARIRDRQSNAVLWEGRAEISTRDGDSHWTEQAVATKLAQALFDGFPNRSDGS